MAYRGVKSNWFSITMKVVAVLIVLLVVYSGVCGVFALVQNQTWVYEFTHICGLIKEVATVPETQALIGLL